MAQLLTSQSGCWPGHLARIPPQLQSPGCPGSVLEVALGVGPRRSRKGIQVVRVWEKRLYQGIREIIQYLTSWLSTLNAHIFSIPGKNRSRQGWTWLVPMHTNWLTMASQVVRCLDSRDFRVSCYCISPPLWSTGAWDGIGGGSGKWLPDTDRCRKNKRVGASYIWPHEMVNAGEAQGSPRPKDKGRVRPDRQGKTRQMPWRS